MELLNVAIFCQSNTGTNKILIGVVSHSGSKGSLDEMQPGQTSGSSSLSLVVQAGASVVHKVVESQAGNNLVLLFDIPPLSICIQ